MRKFADAYLTSVELLVTNKNNKPVACDPPKTITKIDHIALSMLSDRICVSKSIPKEFDNCGGNYDPKAKVTVIIGEQPAGESKQQRMYPFMAMDGCSGWLNRQLAEIHLDNLKMFWVNALNLDGSENDPRIVNSLNPKEIICLGKIAEKWAKKNGWEITTYPHPQYWKRFKSKLPYPLVGHLRRTCSKA